jgi:hypothetical protein
MLDNAFEALNKYDWGTDMAVLAPIEEAVTSAHGKPEQNRELEQRLLTALKGELSRDAHDYVCRKLAVVGSAAAVPALAALLTDDKKSHMARFALERIPAVEAGQALRDALGAATGNLKIGVISSVGSRRDPAAVAALAALLRDTLPEIARAATLALGAIGTAESAAVLQAAMPASGAQQMSIIDALLACAESLRTSQKTSAALAIYKSLAGDSQGRLVRLAATRGILACTGGQA